jgi:hypothetical protein
MADNDDENRGRGEEEEAAANRSGPDRRRLSSHAPGRCAAVVSTEGTPTRRPRRIIKHAFVEGIGPISAEQLIGMPDHE